MIASYFKWNAFISCIVILKEIHNVDIHLNLHVEILHLIFDQRLPEL